VPLGETEWRERLAQWRELALQQAAWRGQVERLVGPVQPWAHRGMAEAAVRPPRRRHRVSDTPAWRMQMSRGQL
jgi:hypothetical protein